MRRLDFKVWLSMTAVIALIVPCLAPVVAATGLQTVGEAEEEIKKLVVMIEAKLAGEPSIGAGIIAGIRADNLYIATANHVVRRGALEAEEIQIRFRWLPDKPVKARLLQHRDSGMDLAVLDVTRLKELAVDVGALPFDCLGSLNLLQRGDALYLLGNPGGRRWRINTTPEKYIETIKDSVEFESNLIAKGHSGGALLNGERELLAMLLSDDPPYGKAIGMARVIGKLKEWGYPVSLRFPHVQISAGHQRTCRAASDGVTKCWGETELEPPDFTAETQFIKNVRLRSISVGLYHICGVAFGGDAYCLGLNNYGQLGRGSKEDAYSSIARVQGRITFASISAGGWHTCGLTPSGGAYCWGAGEEGRLGNDSGNDSQVPVPVSGGLTFKMISAGIRNTCGISTSGAAYCWGGIGGTGSPRGGADPPNAFVPMPVPGRLVFKEISAGYFFICGVTTSGTVYCWGNNEDGQLGNGADKDSDVPVPVSGRLTFKSVSAALGGHACGITTSGAAYCWGLNNFGQLGNGTKKDSRVPVAVSGGLSFVSISAGHFHTCGVTTDGATFCWGAEGMDGLGVGAKTGSAAPVRVPTQP
jgi:alpha-tubulin suppressor-like RCC1 family protein